VVSFFSASSFAGISSEGAAFLSQFPSKMVCSGVEINFITSTRVEMPQKMTIEISGQQTDAPMIEVTTPSASRRNHFKIGNGFGARLEQIGKYSYAYYADKKVLYYVRVANEGELVDDQTLLRIRDAGALISFSESRVCPTTYTCFEFNNCAVERK
jgi:hypothetical protein